MSTPDRIDPVLACLDWLEDYRRSWRCWLIGGPAAVDEITVGGCWQDIGLILNASYETVTEGRYPHLLVGAERWVIRWHDRPEPQPPPPGEFVCKSQAFALRSSLAVATCEACEGTGQVRCTECAGTGKSRRQDGAQPPDAGSQPAGASTDCRACGGTGQSDCTCRDTRSPLALMRCSDLRFEFRHVSRSWRIPECTGEDAELAAAVTSACATSGLHLLLTSSDPRSSAGT